MDEKKITAEKEHEKDVEDAANMLTAEDLVEQAVYAANAPDCCSGAERAKNMLGMLGANVLDEGVYHTEDGCPGFKKDVMESVRKEYGLFKASILSRPPEDIFYNAHEISVKTELSVALQGEVEFDDKIYKALQSEKDEILSNMYNDFCYAPGASVNNFEETQDFIEAYCRRCYEEIMNEDEVCFSQKMN